MDGGRQRVIILMRLLPQHVRAAAYPGTPGQTGAGIRGGGGEEGRALSARYTATGGPVTSPTSDPGEQDGVTLTTEEHNLGSIRLADIHLDHAQNIKPQPRPYRAHTHLQRDGRLPRPRNSPGYMHLLPRRSSTEQGGRSRASSAPKRRS